MRSRTNQPETRERLAVGIRHVLIAVFLLFVCPSLAGAQESGAYLPSKRYRWRAPVESNPLIERSWRDIWITCDAPLSAMGAIPGGDYVMMPGPWMSVAVNFSSGKRIWEFPWVGDDKLRRRVRSPQGTVLTQRTTPEEQGEIGAQRIWGVPSMWSHASDGKRFYYLQPRSVAPIVQRAPMVPTTTLDLNLVCLDLDRQGALRWMVGGPAGGDEPKLANASFLGGPAIDGQSLFAMIFSAGKLKLVELGAGSGDLLSLTEVPLERANMLATARDFYWGQVFTRDDVIVAHLTPSNFVAVFDKQSRKLLWRARGGESPLFAFRRASAFRNRTPGLSGNLIILSHTRPNALSARDVRNGHEKWRSRRETQGLYLATSPEHVLSVGESRVVAIRRDNGAEAWTARLAAKPSGRGFFSKTHYYLPLINRDVLELDLKSGQVSAKTRLPTIPGNLVLYRDNVLAQHHDYLSAYPIAHAMEAQYRKKLEAQPKDAETLVRLALHYSDTKRPQEALAMLLKAEPHADGLVVDDMAECLGSLLPELASARSLAARVEGRVRGRVRVKLLLALARSNEINGQLEMALEQYVKTSELASGEEKIEISGHSTRVDRLIQAALKRILPKLPAARQ